MTCGIKYVHLKNESNSNNMERIEKEEAIIGDYVYVDGDSGFCQGSDERIKSIETRYNEMDGAPYKVVVTAHGSYRFDTGECIKGSSAYRIFSYWRKIKK